MSVDWTQYFERKTRTSFLTPNEWFEYKDKSVVKLPDNLPMPPTDSFYDLFAYCNQLQDITPLANWNVSNIKYMNEMFRECWQLKDITALANWDVSNVKDMFAMFYGCEQLDISSDTDSIKSHLRKLHRRMIYASSLKFIWRILMSILKFIWYILKSLFKHITDYFKDSTIEDKPSKRCSRSPTPLGYKASMPLSKGSFRVRINKNIRAIIDTIIETLIKEPIKVRVKEPIKTEAVKDVPSRAPINEPIKTEAVKDVPSRASINEPIKTEAVKDVLKRAPRRVQVKVPKRTTDQKEIQSDLPSDWQNIELPQWNP